VPNFGFLIVDDASVDTTRDILLDYKRRDARVSILLNAEMLGPYPGLNRALAQARGDVIARHDADDVSPPHRFATQLDALRAREDTSLVIGSVEVFGEDGQTFVDSPPPTQPRLEWELLFRNIVGAGGHAMFPRSIRGCRIFFSETQRYAEDYGLWCRLARLGWVASPPDVVYRYRRHQSSITSQRPAEQRRCFVELRRQYQRHFLASTVDPRVASDLSDFWSLEGRIEDVARIHELLALGTSLKKEFLTYSRRRFGVDAASQLEAELEAASDDRLGYWLFRSIRVLDRRTAAAWFHQARANGHRLTVVGKSAEYGFDAVRRRIGFPAGRAC
jgi:glycosyltransferase involved in cell wall biosynthesis